MHARMLFACLVLALGSALWLGCQVDRAADPVGVSEDDPALGKPVGQAGGVVSAKFDVHAAAKVHAETNGCTNNTGPYIRLNGEISLGGVNAKLVFSNNSRFTHMHEEDVVVSVVLLRDGESIRFEKQPSLGGAGGNPWIYLVFTDDDGEYYGNPQLLGRCVQGFFSAAKSMNLPSSAKATVGTGGCSNSGGPTITLDGELAIGGLSAKLIFTNNRKFRHETSEDIVVDIVIIPAGESIEFAKAPPLGGTGGNPHIFMQFETGKGSPLSDMFYLGRCVQLGD